MNSKKKILIVDDETELVKAIRIRLEQAGYETLVAYDGLEGLEKAKKENPDLILLDIMMPDIDGFEVLRRLKENSKTKYTPVIMVTCKGEPQSLFKAKELRSLDYIVKPFEQEELLDLIKRYI